MSSSWLSVPEDSDFSLSNVPFGVFSPSTAGPSCGSKRRSSSSVEPRCGTIVGDTVIDLSVLEEAGLFREIEGLSANVFCQTTLNAFVEHPRVVWTKVRQLLIDLLSVEKKNSSLCDSAALQEAAFYKIDKVSVHLPVRVGDYTDFYSSREHATNVGIMFRGKDNALQPNWLHLPVGYHGRASTVFVTGRSFHRPAGQLQKDKDDPAQGSVYGPCRLLDFELEVGAVVGGPPNPSGKALTVEEAKSRLFGLVLMNDWSARDIQKWEYVPLGPFTAKNFATTISPWIVTMDALQDFVAPTSAGQQDNPVPLDYLKDPNYSSYDIHLTTAIKGEGQSDATVVCQSNFKNLYWNVAQQLVHHSVTGCIMQAGDLLGSGTISGQSPDAFGSMLELSWKGSKEVKVGDQVRKFLKDGDTVVMKGWCQKEGGGRVGFGECSGTILPALTDAESPQPALKEAQAPRYSDFKLYSYWRSSSTWRVRIALAAKAIEFSTIPIDLMKGEHKTEDFLAKNPLGQVPLLEFTDTVTGKTIRLAQSLAIIDFLDSAFPSRPSLVPKDPVDKAAAYEMAEIMNSGTQPLQNVIYLRELEKQTDGKLKATEQANAVNERGLKALEVLVAARRESGGGGVGPFCMGTFSPTIVDACLAPQVYNAVRFGVSVQDAAPTLHEIDALCAKHPWFQASHPNAQPDAPKS